MQQFITDSLRTESHKFYDFPSNSRERLIHAAFGMQTESAEFTDALKKSLFYGKPLDTTNLKEELGDLLWYVALAMDELNTSFEIETTRVINKLKLRYPEKFTEHLAEHRDLSAERTLLEKDHSCK